MTVRFDMADFLARSTDKPWEETTLAKVLADLPPLTSRGPWIAGGAIRRTLLGQEPDSDFDFFFRNEEQLAAFQIGLDSRGGAQTKATDHHTEYSLKVDGSALPVRIQCIKIAYYETPAQVADSFDFTICQFVYDGRELTLGDFSLWDLGRRRLAVHRITYGVSSMRRLLKYQKQGFFACSGALTAILAAVADNPTLIQSHIQYVD